MESDSNLIKNRATPTSTSILQFNSFSIKMGALITYSAKVWLEMIKYPEKGNSILKYNIAKLFRHIKILHSKIVSSN